MKFIIWAPSFSETDGGSIALHLLCHRLNQSGETALLWPATRPLLRFPSGPRRTWQMLRYALRGRGLPFSTGPFPNGVATQRDLADAIVVYPEIISGNPLQAKSVVRWLLHKPGHFTGTVNYGPEDLFFFVLDAYNDPALNPETGNRLDLIWVNSLYRDEGRVDRHGSCYLMKKGKGRALAHDLRDSIKLDPLPPEQKAEEFNRRERFYCYDPYTMYYMYAAICGCIPIVVPVPGLSKTDWQPREEDRYGVAYGEDDIPWAIETRGRLLARLSDRREAEEGMVAAFIHKCEAWASGR